MLALRYHSEVSVSESCPSNGKQSSDNVRNKKVSSSKQKATLRNVCICPEVV